MHFLVSYVKNILTSSVKKRAYIFGGLLIFISIISYYFLSNNEAFYSKSIAKIINVQDQVSQTENKNSYSEGDKGQKITAVLMNGTNRGQEIVLQNSASDSQVYKQSYKINDEVFVGIDEASQSGGEVYKILDFKRDKYIFYIVILFILSIILIGGIKGFRSLISVLSNAVIFGFIIVLFKQGFNFLLVASIASIFFIIISISIVSGINRKTLSAVAGTVAGTAISMLITSLVIYLTNSDGIHYEEMEFLTHPPQQIFYIEILIGTLGAIMDIAISISSAINEIYENNKFTERKIVVKSGMEIGKDIMGTMANTLVFAYISGSIPIILLWLYNEFSIAEIVNFNLSLEIIRAVTGSIGIVISIPITVLISSLLLKERMIGSESKV